MILTDVTKAAGRTPLVRLERMAKDLPGRVAAKLELMNSCGSVKDRLGLALIEDAERRGVLRTGVTLIEATGGNTGIGLACAAAVRDYRLVLTMPESMSVERVALLRHLGAEVELTPGILMGDAVARARQLIAEIPQALMLDQFANPANAAMHRRTTGPEIWDDTPGRRRCVRLRNRYRWHRHGRGRVAQATQTGCSSGGGGASRRRRALRAAGRPAPDTGHRRRFHSCGAKSLCPGRGNRGF